MRTERRLLMTTHNLTKPHRHHLAAISAWNGPPAERTAQTAPDDAERHISAAQARRATRQPPTTAIAPPPSMPSPLDERSGHDLCAMPLVARDRFRTAAHRIIPRTTRSSGRGPRRRRRLPMRRRDRATTTQPSRRGNPCSSKGAAAAVAAIAFVVHEPRLALSRWRPHASPRRCGVSRRPSGQQPAGGVEANASTAPEICSAADEDRKPSFAERDVAEFRIPRVRV